MNVRTLCLAAIVLCTCGRIAHAQSSFDRFKKAYPALEAQIDEFYRNLTINATARFRNVPDEPENSLKAIFWGGGTRVGYELTYLTDRENYTHWFTGGQDIVCATPEATFAIRSQRDGTLVVTSLRREASAAASAIEKMRNHLIFPFAAYTIRGTKITEFLNDRVFRYVSIEDETIDGQKVTKLNWRAAIEDAERGGWFRFLPDAGWVLLGYQINHRRKEKSQGSQMNGAMVYETIDGLELPVIKSVRLWSLSPEDNGRESNVSEYAITRVQRGVPDPDVFHLSHYDLEPRVRKRLPPYLILAVALAICCVGAVSFRYLANRARAKT